MDFPIGSLAVLILLTLIAFEVVTCQIVERRILILGLMAILLGNFLSVPLPSPKGVQANLNVGQAVMPVLLVVAVGLKLPAEDKYRASVGTVAIGLLLYGLTTLFEVEPGLMQFPLIFSVPLSVILALLTAKTMLPSALAMVGGSTLVLLIRYMETSFSLQVNTVVDLPGALIWNTTSFGIVFGLGINWCAGLVKTFVVRHTFRPAVSEAPVEGREILRDSCEINLAGEEHENNL